MSRITYDEADERAQKFFTHVFIGKNINGADQFGYTWSFSTSHKDLKPTQTFKLGSTTYCHYCGKSALSIQGNLNRFAHRMDTDYDVTGYTCACKDAMDEVEYSAKKEVLLRKHEQELHELRKEKPTASATAIKSVIDAQMKQAAAHAERGDWHRYSSILENITRSKLRIPH